MTLANVHIFSPFRQVQSTHAIAAVTVVLLSEFYTTTTTGRGVQHIGIYKMSHPVATTTAIAPHS